MWTVSQSVSQQVRTVVWPVEAHGCCPEEYWWPLGPLGLSYCGLLTMEARLLLARYTGRQDLINKRGEEGQNEHTVVRGG